MIFESSKLHKHNTFVNRVIEGLYCYIHKVRNGIINNKDHYKDVGSPLGSQIHNLCLSPDPKERSQALKLILHNRKLLKDKQLLWDDIVTLTNDENRNTGRDASVFLFYALSLVPNKQKAWNDLLRLLCIETSYTRQSVASNLGFAFFQLQDDKQQAWETIHQLAKSECVEIRQGIASSLSFVFSQLQDKQQAWNDLHKLTEDVDSEVRERAVISLGDVFSDIPEQCKQQACDDLHRLTLDDAPIKKEVAITLGFIFPDIPNKQQAHADLIIMADEELEKNEDIKTQANYALGRALIYYAAQAENDEEYKIKFEKAISYFDKSAQTSSYDWLDPSKFCRYYYRSLYALIFEMHKGRQEIDDYLENAERSINKSENKRLYL